MLSLLARLAASATRPEAAAIARMVVGMAAFLKSLERAPVLARMADPTVVRVPYLEGQPSIADLPPEAVLALWGALALAFAIGLATRVAGAGLTLLLLAIMFSDQQLYSNHLYLLIWLVGLLTAAGPGAALSVDAMRGHGRATIPAWPIHLLRLQVSLVYLFAGITKINAVYLSGAIIAVTLRRDGFLAIPDEWRVFEFMFVAAILSIIAEVGIAIALWLPRWRRTAFVVALGLHASLAVWFVPTLPLLVFGAVALAPFVLFLDLQPRPLVLVFDDSCGFCTQWVRWLRRLDWLRFLQLIPGSDATALARLEVPREDADRALQLVRNGRRSQGFDAVIGVLEHLPVSFLWAPLLRLWPVRHLGRRLYARVAARRQCAIGSGAAAAPSLR